MEPPRGSRNQRCLHVHTCVCVCVCVCLFVIFKNVSLIILCPSSPMPLGPCAQMCWGSGVGAYTDHFIFSPNPTDLLTYLLTFHVLVNSALLTATSHKPQALSHKPQAQQICSYPQYPHMPNIRLTDSKTHKVGNTTTHKTQTSQILKHTITQTDTPTIILIHKPTKTHTYTQTQLHKHTQTH